MAQSKIPTLSQIEDGRASDLFVTLMQASVSDLILVALSAYDLYLAAEQPDDRGSLACYAEALPEFEEALRKVGMLR